MVERVTERTDGVITERVTESDGGGETVVVQTRSGGGAGVLIGFIVLILVVVGGVYLFNQNSRENAKTDAITTAADKVGDAADKIGDSAKDAVNKIQ